MTNKEQLALIRSGSEVWNAWRVVNPYALPGLCGADLRSADLRGADLRGADLHGADLRHADLRSVILSGAKVSAANFSGANLTGANLSGANLSEADLTGAILIEANLSGAILAVANLMAANLSRANLSEANLSRAYFIGTKLIEADLTKAKLSGTRLSQANLTRANFSEAHLDFTTLIRANASETDFTDSHCLDTMFLDIDLSVAKGLETVVHDGPSIIGIDTLFKSNGKIPKVFLREAGVPEDFITQIPSLIVGIEPIQFHSCFISYSHKDEEFARRLYSRMRSENLRVWYAPEDMKGGKKLHEEIFHAIQIHDKLLLVLSDNSMKSEWVTSEIRRARRIEREKNRRKLFPIRLVGFNAIQEWECFDADSGKDLAIELREFYIPDFSNWKDNDAFEREFARLLRDLKATER